MQSGKHLSSIPQQLKDHTITADLMLQKSKENHSLTVMGFGAGSKISPAYVILTLWKPKALQFNYTHPQLKKREKSVFMLNNNQGFVPFERKVSALNLKDSNLLSQNKEKFCKV